MISLEQSLAIILRQIEATASAGDAQGMADLMARKDAICRMLCALAQA